MSGGPAHGGLPPQGPGGPVHPGPVGPPGPGRPNLWRQATSTTGGTIAVIVAACLVALLVLGMAGAAALVGARVVAGNHREERMEQMRERLEGQLPPGQRKKLDQQAPKPDREDRGNGQRNGQGNGLGPLMRGAKGLGDVQHGEFTVQGADAKATVMTVQRGTVTAASATSVTVKSDDGFTATYAVGDSTRGKAGAVSKGDTVVVVAQKDGAKALMIRATRAD